MTQTARPALIRLTGITKCYGPLLANDNIDFVLWPGEIVGLLGENGAGKSTLMNIVYGLARPDSGRLEIEGRPLAGHTPAAAIRAGIGMVHQHFMLVPTLTVTENIILGREPRRGPLLDLKGAQIAIGRLIAEHGFDLDPRAMVSTLTVAQRQRLEILRALFQRARVLILDEPTSVLAPAEVERLFALLRRLAESGIGIVLIAHKLDEVLSVCHRLVVLRTGRVIGERPTDRTNARELTEMMIGYDAAMPAPQIRPPAGAVMPVLVVDNIETDSGPSSRLRGLVLHVDPGEIVGLAGVDGNGQRDLEMAVVGLMPITSGRLLLGERDITHASAAVRRKVGLGYVPQDRHSAGLVGNLSLLDNMMLGRHRTAVFSTGGILRLRRARSQAARELTALDVRYRTVEDPAASLSGGNQQKLVLARAMAANPKILLASQISRGLDVGAIAGIYRQILALRAQGTGILLISFDLDEILALSDRIGVMRRGRLVAQMTRAEATRESIGAAMMAAA